MNLSKEEIELIESWYVAASAESATLHSGDPGLKRQRALLSKLGIALTDMDEYEIESGRA